MCGVVDQDRSLKSNGLWYKHLCLLQNSCRNLILSATNSFYFPVVVLRFWTHGLVLARQAPLEPHIHSLLPSLTGLRGGWFKRWLGFCPHKGAWWSELGPFYLPSCCLVKTQCSSFHPGNRDWGPDRILNLLTPWSWAASI